ncbi:hypothetical protein [Amycolatopsis benzoatilytica]|uniref:hypothetical protein n=1 Tax=Amycolatopsis benzoatilytica TaxID=346045 RepID=UPI0012B67E09|nr:hypothetical protein [Amycolatopsis benzoatilytica]
MIFRVRFRADDAAAGWPRIQPRVTRPEATGSRAARRSPPSEPAVWRVACFSHPVDTMPRKQR